MDTVEESLSLLGLRGGASWEEINEAYRDLIRVWHPDRFQNDVRLKKRSEEQTTLLNQAIRTLRKGYEPSAFKKAAKGTNYKQATVRRGKATFDSQAVRGQSTRQPRYEMAPLLVYQRPLTCIVRISGAAILGYLSYLGATHSADSNTQTAFSSTVSLLAINIFARNTILLFVRKPVIRVDSKGIRGAELGSFTWGDLQKVWTFMDATAPTLAIECSDLYVRDQPWALRLLMKMRHFIRRAHFVVSCAGLDAHPNDVVRAINALHLTGNVQSPQVRREATKPHIPWCRLLAAICAVVLISRCLLGRDMSIIDFGLYFAVFFVCQVGDLFSRLVRS